MLEKNKVFFGEKGHTATSLSHLVNIATLQIQEFNSEIENLSFLSKSISLLDSQHDSKTISIGKDIEFLDNIESKINKVGLLKGFIAWVREAVKAKEFETKRLNLYSFNDYINDLKLDVRNPVYKPDVNADDVISEYNIRIRADYFRLQALASNIGSIIHSDGQFDKAVKKYQHRVNNPIEVTQDGKNTIIVEYAVSISSPDLESRFMHLQKTYREYQAEFNKLQYTIEKEVQQRNIAIKLENAKISQEHNAKISSLQSDFELYVMTELKYIQDLKIVLPNAFTEVFNYLNSLTNGDSDSNTN